MEKSICSQRKMCCPLGADALSNHRMRVAVIVLRCSIRRE
jgi:hypothetical protein